VIGCPVGFIGAAESKQALESFAAEHGVDLPFLTVRGRRGGSAMTASALNALAQEQE
jgi:precorrin-8X/cobalt-precorrin-8 methylmutase